MRFNPEVHTVHDPGGVWVIHNLNGQIGRKKSYGNAPRPPAAPSEKNR